MFTAAQELVELASRATPEAVEVARTVLAQSVADAAWAGQLGPALSQADTARLLGKSEQAVSKDARLLRLRNRDGRPVYPLLQFDGRGQVAGVSDVVAVLSRVFHPLNVASWLTSTNPALRQRPIDALRRGHVEQVLAAARRLAADAA